jgi:hypothetical protein
MSMLGAGDTVVIWRLDRLGRSLKNLIELVEQLEAAKVGLRSLQENIDTARQDGHTAPPSTDFERREPRGRRQVAVRGKAQHQAGDLDFHALLRPDTGQAGANS